MITVDCKLDMAPPAPALLFSKMQFVIRRDVAFELEMAAPVAAVLLVNLQLFIAGDAFTFLIPAPAFDIPSCKSARPEVMVKPSRIAVFVSSFSLLKTR